MTGPVTIVTGGTFGIGRAITRTLSARGHRVVAFGLETRHPPSMAENVIPDLRADCDGNRMAMTHPPLSYIACALPRKLSRLSCHCSVETGCSLHTSSTPNRYCSQKTLSILYTNS